MMGFVRFVLRLFSAPDAAFEEAVEQLRRRPESGQPITRAELLGRLRALAERRPTTKLELTQLEAESIILSERIGRSPVCSETPHDIWHFLSDADIRFRDAAYGEKQIAGTLELVRRWERDSGV